MTTHTLCNVSSMGHQRHTLCPGCQEMWKREWAVEDARKTKES